MNKTLPIHFKLKQFQPDKSQYQVTKTIFEPCVDFIVVVELPLERQYIYNVEKILMAQIAGDKHDDPLFTPEGLHFIEQILLSRNDDKALPYDPNDIEWEKE